MLSQNYTLRDIEFINLWFKLKPLIYTLGGTYAAYFIYSYALLDVYKIKQTAFFQVFYNFLSRK
jgi:hypothetical protein